MVHTAWERIQGGNGEAREVTKEVLSLCAPLFSEFESPRASAEEAKQHLTDLIEIGLFSISRPESEGGIGGEIDPVIDAVRHVAGHDLSLALLLADHSTTLLPPASFTLGPGASLQSSWGGIAQAFGHEVAQVSPSGLVPSGPLSRGATSLGLRSLLWVPERQSLWVGFLESQHPPGATHRRLTLTAAALGCAEGLFREALKHATTRVQFRKRLLDNTVIAKRLLDMRVRIWTTCGLLGIAQNGAGIRGEREAQVYSAVTARICAEGALQILGGNGLTEDLGIPKRFRDAQGLVSLFFGDAERAISGSVDGRAARRWMTLWGGLQGDDPGTLQNWEAWGHRPDFDRLFAWEAIS